MSTFYGLPEEVVFCRRCVISNQRPSSTVEFKSNVKEKKKTIAFRDDGICDACHYQDVKNNNIDWAARERTSSDYLIVLEEMMVATMLLFLGSGGKDSAYTSHILKYKYGMNPLTVTWAPHKYTDIGFKNFENWLHVGGHDNILFTPNGRLHRHLTKLAFKNLLHPFQPFIVGQRIIGPRIARQFGIPLVMYGENQAEYGNNVDDNYTPKMDEKFFSVDEIDQINLGGESIRSIIESTDFTVNDFAPYIPPSIDELKEAKIEVHYLGFYLKWDPQECYYYAVENTGFEANPERTPGTYSKYSSIDDKIDMFHYFTTLIKFGIGRATYDAAQEIRNGKITREEGVHLVRKYDQEFPKKFFADFLEYISLSENEFWEIVDTKRSPHLWEKSGNDWRLKFQVD